MARLHLPGPLAAGMLPLPPPAARHLQALRLRAGAELTVFDGSGGEWAAVLRESPPQAAVELLAHRAVERELPWHAVIALVMPANERMDGVVEKATELGAARVQPLMGERSVLRLHGERAQRRVAHWQGVALAACEQCGRNRLPDIATPRALSEWLAALPPASGEEARVVLAAPAQGRAAGFREWAGRLGSARRLLALSGPEGGLSDAELAAAAAAGFEALSLGPRVLRADTAPLAWLAALAAWAPPTGGA